MVSQYHLSKSKSKWPPWMLAEIIMGWWNLGLTYFELNVWVFFRKVPLGLCLDFGCLDWKKLLTWITWKDSSGYVLLPSSPHCIRFGFENHPFLSQFTFYSHFSLSLSSQKTSLRNHTKQSGVSELWTLLTTYNRWETNIELLFRSLWSFELPFIFGNEINSSVVRENNLVSVWDKTFLYVVA